MAKIVNNEELARTVGACFDRGSDIGLKVIEAFQATIATPIAKKMHTLKMKEIIRNKNPYLYRASGVNTCSDLVERAFHDFISSSMENYSGYFFEAISQIFSGGIKPVNGGEVDLDIRKGDTAYLYGELTHSITGTVKAERLRRIQEVLNNLEIPREGRQK